MKRQRGVATRRSVLTSTLLALTARLVPLPAWIGTGLAQENIWRHGVSRFDDFKYPAGFKHFDYVNADAPKGGSVRQTVVGTFDNFNVVIAGVKGSLAAGIALINETLLVASLDEVSSEYGLLAEAVSYPADFSLVTFRLRPEARWHDGAPVTPEDVIFSFDAYKRFSPEHRELYRHVVKAEKTAEREITFTFDGPGRRGLPQNIGRLTVLPKHWWQDVNKAGKRREVGATTLKAPLGSSAYRIREFSPGRSVIYERVKGYWGSALNVNIGRDNFDELRYEYFRDPAIALETFKTDQSDWLTENSAKNWVSGYDFPAVRDRRVRLEEFPISDIGIMLGFAFNIRRAKFKDPRVRLAFNYAFNFERMNRQIFFGQYERIDSYFKGSELAASGIPTGRELELLETVRDKLPASVFEKPYSNPLNSDAKAVRKNLREAARLLKEAGYEVHKRRLTHVVTGAHFAVELLSDQRNFERVFLFYKRSLERLGLHVVVRTVDQAQYQNRLRNWDFDIVTAAWKTTLWPGAEQRDYWGSQAADQPGSRNLIGIKNSAVDAMIEQIVVAKNRSDLEAATRALDRILLWSHYTVPQWIYSKVRTARWDRYGHPNTMPKYGGAAFPTVWWRDTSRAESSVRTATITRGK